MAQWSSYLLLLVLLVPIISLCESAEYYIRPTAPTTNTSCPGQPCLTLNHYMSNTSYYIQSNTVLNFLPGKHVLKRPLHINNVHNVTLKSNTAGSGMYSRPRLLVKFSCENESLNHCIYTQSAIEMINVTNVVINDISLEMWTPEVSGVIVEQSTDVHLQLHIHSVQGNDSLAVGIVVNETSHVYMDGLRGDNLYNGIRIENTNRVSIINSSFDNCQNSGMIIIESNAIDISNTILSNNMKNGMYLESCSNTTLTSISATNNQQDGMDLISCSTVSLKNISVINNFWDGIYLFHCKHVKMMTMYLEKNQQNGMYFYSCENTTMMNISAIDNQRNEMYLESCKNTTMMNLSAINNHDTGILFQSCENTAMMNIYAINNQNGGMLFHSCENTTMMNVSTINNHNTGILFQSCKNTTMMNTYAINNQGDGMFFKSCKNTTMMNTYVINNQGDGMLFESCENTTMMNISAINNQGGGIGISDSENATIANTYTINNQNNGVDVHTCENTSITNVFAINNTNDGIINVNCTNTILTDINATYNQNGGIVMESHFQNTVLRNISVNHNGANQITISSSDTIQLEYSTFSDIIELPTLNIATNPHTVPVVIELNDCTLIMSNCIFTSNNITSIRAIGSTIIPEGEVIFSDNRALSGAALLFVSSSVLVISESSTVCFQNNYAVNYGGAIYILTDEYYTKSKSFYDILSTFTHSVVTPRTRCFLSVEGNRSLARLIFTNNTAGKGGDVVYGGLVAMGYDGDWNCLLSFKYISDMSQQNGLSTISSEPSRVCLCHNGQPDCLIVADPITRNIYPGQTITLPAVVVGQDFGTVTGSVIPQFLQDYTTCSIQFEQTQRSIFVNSSQCADLRYTLYTSGGENCTAILTLKTNNAEVLQPMNTDDNHKLNHSWTILNEEPNSYELVSYLTSLSFNSNYSESFINNFFKYWDEKFVFPNEIYSYPTFINISFRSCPLGFALSRNQPFKCDCNHLLQQMPRVTCDIQHQTISRDGLVWVGTYGNNTVAASKYCPYNYCKSVRTNLTALESESDYINHSTTDVQCNLRHSGVLCGGCQPGLSLALGTNQCLRCSNVYIPLLLPFTVAGLLLVFFIKLLNLTIYISGNTE